MQKKPKNKFRWLICLLEVLIFLPFLQNCKDQNSQRIDNKLIDTQTLYYQDTGRAVRWWSALYVFNPISSEWEDMDYSEQLGITNASEDQVFEKFGLPEDVYYDTLNYGVRKGDFLILDTPKTNFILFFKLHKIRFSIVKYCKWKNVDGERTDRVVYFIKKEDSVFYTLFSEEHKPSEILFE